MRKILFCLLLIPTVLQAQQPLYTAANLPLALTKNADAVYWIDEGELDISSPSKYTLNRHQIITLLNAGAKDHLVQVFGTDKFYKMENIQVYLYNSQGVQVKKFTKKDFQTESYDDNISVLTDDKIMYLQTSAPGYPCTIEIRYQQNVSSYLTLPSWSFNNPDEAVITSRYSVLVPQDLDIRQRTRGSNLAPVITTEGKKKKYYWEMSTIPAQQAEKGASRDYTAFPVVELAPNKFEYDGYPGNFATWADFGRWNYPMYESAAPFDESRKAAINGILQGAASQKEKIARLYKYMQDNLRYVSIQLGIGGFKPFDVAFVDKMKYGDCKALSNYMRNMLKVAGIESYPALVYGGTRYEPLDPVFPAIRFNHVILCAIADGDSTWLECTSSDNDAGSLGTFTENRYALLLTPDGGKLVTTPRSKAADNVFNSTTTVDLKDDGSGITKTIISGTGDYRSDFIHYIGEEKKDEQKKYLLDNMGFIQPDYFELVFTQSNKRATVELAMSLEKIPEFTAGSKMFLSPRIYKIWSSTLPAYDNRKNDYYMEMPLIKTDTTIYRLPPGYGVDNLPTSKKIQFEYGSFSSNYVFDEQQKAVIATARLELKQHVIPAAKYKGAHLFFNEIIGEYTEKLVVKRL